MPVNTYETMFLLDAAKLTADADGVKQQVNHALEKHGGQIIVSRPWDYNHKLTYPIRKQKKGAFHIVYYTMDSAKQAPLEQDIRLLEVVLRHLTILLDPKWSEAVLQVAKEDGGNGFAVRGMHDEATVTTDPAAIGGDPMMGMGEGELMGGGGGPRRRGGGRRFEGGDKPD